MRFFVTVISLLLLATSCGYGPKENFKLDLVRVDASTVKAKGEIQGAKCAVLVAYDSIIVLSSQQTPWDCYNCIKTEYVETNSEKGVKSFDFTFSANDDQDVEGIILCKSKSWYGNYDRILQTVLKGTTTADPEVTVPWDPFNLAVFAMPSWINIDWVDNSDNEDGFKIYRGVVQGGPYTLLHTTGPNTSHYEDSTGDSGTTYYYIVKAYNTAGESGPTIEESDTAQ